MQTPRVVTSAWTALAIAALAFTPTAVAKSHQVEPLNQYLVTGKISGDDLARQGYDMREAVTPGAGGAFSIVATPQQAASLRDKGATVRAPYGLARSRSAPSSPLTPPTHGYDVFRPWSLTPAACPTTCATPERQPEDLVPRPVPRQPRHRQGSRLRQVRARPGPRRLPPDRRRG